MWPRPLQVSLNEVIWLDCCLPHMQVHSQMFSTTYLNVWGFYYQLVPNGFI